MKHIIETEISSHLKSAEQLEKISGDIEVAAKLSINTLSNNNKILLCGNGGSAADSQHIAAELVGRYKRTREGLSAIALTTDSSILTSISNDFEFDDVFSRQIEALAHQNDLLFAFSTSGNSKNIINAAKKCNSLKCKVISFTGAKDSELMNYSDLVIKAPSIDTPRIQEMHILIGHIICEIIDNTLSS